MRVVVETPRGACIKLKYEPEIRAFALSRSLVLGISYPYDWGFVPSTLAEDGDPLDAMVLFDGATYPGVVIACRPLGVVELTQKKQEGEGRQRNDRLIVTPVAFDRHAGIRGPDDLEPRVRQEIELFFVNAVQFTGKEVKIEGWGGPKAAKALLERAEKRFAKTAKKR